MTVVHIGFLDWTSGGLLGDYQRAELPGEANAELVKEAASDLAAEGAGYFNGAEDSPTAEQLADPLFSPPYERYWVHADGCAEVEYPNSWDDNCACDLEKFNGEFAV